MEKKIAHYPLSTIKELVRCGRVRATKAAITGAAALNFNFEDIHFVVESLESHDLYKSMTSDIDKSIWQDVYHYPANSVDIYLKLQILEGVVIISFKEL